MNNTMENDDEIICPDCGEPLAEHIDKSGNTDEFVDYISNSYTNLLFEDFWNERKHELNQLSKKEIAEEAFFQSIANFLHNYIENRLEDEENFGKDN
ncbi:MAG: hypothetical protein Q7S27_01835 [Nanoarchaeota archaeon]|nr:hypothetical protein [Nanoarchaeota archaeon]